MKDSNTTAPKQPSSGHSFGMVQADIFRDPTLPSSVKLVYVAIATYASPDRRAFPSQDRLAADTGLSVRTVKRAMKVAEDAGLLAVRRTQGVNHYQLNDFSVGGYVVGSGPECHGGTSEVPDSHSGSATVAHEQDHSTRPASQTTSSGVACAAGALREAPGDTHARAAEPIRIFAKRGMSKWAEDSDVIRYLISVAVKAMQNAGWSIHDEAADAMGSTLRKMSEDGRSRDEMLAAVEAWVNGAGTNGKNGWLASRPAA